MDAPTLEEVKRFIMQTAPRRPLCVFDATDPALVQAQLAARQSGSVACCRCGKGADVSWISHDDGFARWLDLCADCVHWISSCT